MDAEQPVVVPYRPVWAVEADHLVALLWAGLGDVAIRIDHIGSTAIPGMASKHVLDLQVSVEDLEVAGCRKPVLEGLGFKLSPIESDHVPAGRLHEPALWSKRLWLRRQQAATAVNLHIRRSGSPGERLALLFRDWFRAHPEAVDGYGAFKVCLSQACRGVGTYVKTKDPIVDVIVVAAEEWASVVNWHP